MSLEPQEARLRTADRADDEKTIREEELNNDDGSGVKPKKDKSYDLEKPSRPISRSSSIQAAEKPEAPQADIGDPPDGGLRAWLVVLGVRPHYSQAEHFSNNNSSLPLVHSLRSVS